MRRTLAILAMALIGFAAPAAAQSSKRVIFHSRLAPHAEYAGIWGYAAAGREYALLGEYTGTMVVDVTDPDNPVERAYVSGTAVGLDLRDVRTAGHYAYSSGRVYSDPGGLQIIDLAGLPGTVSLVGTYTQSFNSGDTLFVDSQDRIFVSGLGAGGTGGVKEISLADPIHPVDLGLFAGIPLPIPTYASHVRGNLLFSSNVYDGNVQILDITNRSRPTVLSTLPEPLRYSWNVTVTDDGRHLLAADFRKDGGGYLSIYDVSNPNAPSRVSSFVGPNSDHRFHTSIRDVRVKGDLAYCAWTEDGLRIVDIADPTMPVEVGFYDQVPPEEVGDDQNVPPGTRGVYPYLPSGNILMSDYEDGLFVLSFTGQYGILTGTVRDAVSGLPIPGASVRRIGENRPVSTNEGGRYALDADPGPVTLGAIAQGYRGRFVSTTAAVGPRKTVDIELTPLPAGSISGVVTTASGDALEGAQVTVAGTALSATSDAAGIFSLPRVPRGVYTLRAAKLGFTPVSEEVEATPQRPASVSLSLAPAYLAFDMESDPGWLVNPLNDDSAMHGAWERVDPIGTHLYWGDPSQPEDDHTPGSGSTAFVTGQGEPGGGAVSADVKHGRTTLRTQLYDISNLDHPVISYFSWYSAYPSRQRWHVDASTDYFATWFPLEDGIPEQDYMLPPPTPRWREVNRSVQTVLARPSSVGVRFLASDSDNNTGNEDNVTEAGVDDFQVLDSCDARALPGLADADGDGISDACDFCPADAMNDADQDGWCSPDDNAPAAFNPLQADADGDGIGDAGDDCPATPNVDQADNDRDGLGDVCDPDDDNDGIADVSDPDLDGDGVPNALDNCPTAANPNQHDRDADGAGDACDGDDGLIAGVEVYDGSAQGTPGIDLRWKAEAGQGAYHVYRATLDGSTSLADADCFERVATPHAVDTATPLPGTAFVYVMTKVSTLTVNPAVTPEEGNEGSPGYASSGAERVVIRRCPAPFPFFSGQTQN